LKTAIDWNGSPEDSNAEPNTARWVGPGGLCGHAEPIRHSRAIALLHEPRGLLRDDMAAINGRPAPRFALSYLVFLATRSLMDIGVFAKTGSPARMQRGYPISPKPGTRTLF
jgi:hypothetical protein